MKKYIVCKKCGFENLPGTQFCQRCGSKISLKFTDKIASSLAGTGQKGSSLAPLGAIFVSEKFIFVVGKFLYAISDMLHMSVGIQRMISFWFFCTS